MVGVGVGEWAGLILLSVPLGTVHIGGGEWKLAIKCARSAFLLVSVSGKRRVRASAQAAAQTSGRGQTTRVRGVGTAVGLCS